MSKYVSRVLSVFDCIQLSFIVYCILPTYLYPRTYYIFLFISLCPKIILEEEIFSHRRIVLYSSTYQNNINYTLTLDK